MMMIVVALQLVQAGEAAEVAVEAAAAAAAAAGAEEEVVVVAVVVAAAAAAVIMPAAAALGAAARHDRQSRPLSTASRVRENTALRMAAVVAPPTAVESAVATSRRRIRRSELG